MLACLEKDPAKRPKSAEQLLRMVRQCRPGESWDHDTARGWRQTHLPELTGALTVADAPFESADRTLVVA